MRKLKKNIISRAPMHIYAFPIYMAWDRDGTRKPPKGYRSWMEYREHIRKANENGRASTRN